MQLQVANSKAEIRRVWNEAQEKLKVSKYTQKESSFTRSGSLTQPYSQQKCTAFLLYI